MRKEKEEKRNPQEPKPLISTPEVTWSTARAGGPCRAPNPGVMSRWNRDITPLLRREVPERPAPLVGAASACSLRRASVRRACSGPSVLQKKSFTQLLPIKLVAFKKSNLFQLVAFKNQTWFQSALSSTALGISLAPVGPKTCRARSVRGFGVACASSGILVSSCKCRMLAVVRRCVMLSKIRFLRR